LKQYLATLFAVTFVCPASIASAGDSDGDGIPDAADNCTERPNESQRDTDLDGYGNVCDPDFTNDGTVGGPDFLVLAKVPLGAELGDAAYRPEVDMTGDGEYGASDYVLYSSMANKGRGPSGLACAGNTPCPAPNFLVLLMDDVGLDKIGLYGLSNDVPATPTVDALAEQGLRFSNAWSNPSCSPTRASMLTGLYPVRTGIGAPLANDRPIFGLDPGLRSIADVLGESGYETAAFGKWHLSSHCKNLTDADGGCGPEYDLEHPIGMGFDHFEGTLGNISSYCDWPKTTARRVGEQVSSDSVGVRNTYVTADTVDDAIAKIGIMAEPWFAWVAFNAAHTPFHEVAREGPACPLSVSSLSEPEQYRSMVERLDAEIGRLLQSIPFDVRARTTVLLMSDNGTPSGALEPPFDTHPAKGTVYRGGIDVPLVATGPTVTPRRGGAVTDALVDSSDIFATLADLAARAEPGTDSRSFARSLSNAGRTSERRIASSAAFRPRGVASLREATRDGRYKLIRMGSSQAPLHFEAYDLESDPLEDHDLVPTLSFIQRSRLQPLLARLQKTHGSFCIDFDDVDGDCRPNVHDNCTSIPNTNQCDTDRDGFGNVCDGDFDGDGVAGISDWIALEDQLEGGSYHPDFDLNCDGGNDAADLEWFRFGNPPGPSGLSCAGMGSVCP